MPTLSVLLGAALCVAPPVVPAAAPAAPVLRLASPGLSTVNLKPELGTFFSEHLAQQMKLAGAELFTPKEIAALLGLERQKQLIGCGEESTSCLAELASALGADGVVLGDVAKVGERVIVNVKIIATKNGKTVAAFSDSAPGEDGAVDVLTKGARMVASQSAGALTRSLTPSFEEQKDRRGLAVIPLIAGVVLGGAGGYAFYDSGQKYALLVAGTPKSVADGRSVQSTGALEQQLGVVGLGLGAAGVVAAAVVFFTGRPAGVDLTPTAAPGPSGSVLVGLSGSLP